MNSRPGAPARSDLRHCAPVRIAHWINAVAFLFLVPSGIAILVAHPEFYWGETGYFGAPAWLALPIEPDFDQTGWGRGMHFLFAWILVLNGLVYLVWGFASGHFARKLLPSGREVHWRAILCELRRQMPCRGGTAHLARSYNVLQKIAYLLVVFLLFPVLILSGLAMSPAVLAAMPELAVIFAGRQSARTIHFIVANLLLVFLVVHLVQVMRAGAMKEVRGMITGRVPAGAEGSK